MSQLNQENMLSRWSRRKQQSQLETKQEDQLIENNLQGLSKLETDQTENVDQLEPVVVLTDEDMPAINTLNSDSDFSGFMSSGVSDELRNLALRKLFKAPSFNIRDGLDEYDEDYTTFEKLGDLVTCDMKHQIEMEAKKKLEEEANKLNESDSIEASEQVTSASDLTEQSEENTLDDVEQIDSSVNEQALNDAPEITSNSTARTHE